QGEKRYGDTPQQRAFLYGRGVSPYSRGRGVSPFQLKESPHVHRAGFSDPVHAMPSLRPSVPAELLLDPVTEDHQAVTEMDVLYHDVVRELQVHRREVPQPAYAKPRGSVGCFACYYTRIHEQCDVQSVAAHGVLQVSHIHDFDTVHFLPDQPGIDVEYADRFEPSFCKILVMGQRLPHIAGAGDYAVVL